uniref:Transmembrane protein n=1 Tax=Picea sitchensis TaxID=3332 RepID=D5A9B3_PICSI|nr:unknown [Picea sitchensis]
MAYECFEGSLRRSSGIFCPLPCSRIFTVLASSSIVCLRGLLALRLSLLVDWVSLICALVFWFMWLRSPLRPFVDFEAPSVQFIWWLSLLVDWVSPICALGFWFMCSGALVFVASPLH